MRSLIALLCSARWANRPSESGLKNSVRASKGARGPSGPGKGSSAALIPTIAAGEHTRSSAIRTAMAAPAECPTSAAGETSSVFRRSPTARATFGSVKSLLLRGVAVKPWPGKSRATTWWVRASSGVTSRQECVAAPVPCNRTSVGPSPMTCTCQRRPRTSMKRLASRLGQSRPCTFQSGARVIAVTGRLPAPQLQRRRCRRKATAHRRRPSRRRALLRRGVSGEMCQ